MTIDKETISKMEKFLISEYADGLVVFNNELTYERNIFAHKVDTPYGKIVRLQTSPTSKGGKGITFWNWA